MSDKIGLEPFQKENGDFIIRCSETKREVRNIVCLEVRAGIDEVLSFVLEAHAHPLRPGFLPPTKPTHPARTT